MVNKKRAKFFLSLPKKELQTLCRKYGMPSYKPKPYLAETLAALLPENFELKDLIHKCAHTSCSQPAERGQNSLDLNVLPRIPGKTCSGRMVNAPSASKLLAENAYVESVRSEEVSTPSFEFHVQSEAGINIYVDLNSNPSEWAESLKKNICVPESSSCAKTQRLHADLARFGESSSYLKGSSPATVSETNVEHLPSGMAPNLENKERSSKDFDCLDRVDGSMMSSVEVSHTREEGFSKDIEESKAFIVPKSSSYIQNPTPVSVSSDDPKTGNVGDSLSNSISDGAMSFLTSEQPLKVITEECATSPVRYDCNPSCLGSAVHKSSKFASVEKQPSGTASFQKDKLLQCRSNLPGSVDYNCNMASEQGESANSSEVDHGTERNGLLICPEKEERSSTACEMETSECSGFDKSSKRNSLMASDSNSSKYPERQSSDCVQANGSNTLETRNLRRLNHLPGEVLPRRSMRELITCGHTT